MVECKTAAVLAERKLVGLEPVGLEIAARKVAGRKALREPKTYECNRLIRAWIGEQGDLQPARRVSGLGDGGSLWVVDLRLVLCAALVAVFDGRPVVVQDGHVEVVRGSSLSPSRNPAGSAIWRDMVW